MKHLGLILFFAASAWPALGAADGPSTKATTTATPPAATAPAPRSEQPIAPRQPPAFSLVEVRRIYVERLNGNDGAAQIRDMLINALEQSHEFVLTENEERADAVLRGSAEDLVFTDVFQSSDSLHANASLSGSSGNSESERIYGTGGTASSIAKRASRAASVGVGETESTRIQERKHEATASVRLVNRDGDVLWSATEESLGAKFKGAGADVADRIARKLLAELARARKATANGQPTGLAAVPGSAITPAGTATASRR